jgi:hypothetical protein
MIKTIPGNAKAIGYFMEGLNWKEVKGVISGNDQCFLLCRTEKEAEDMKRRCISIWNKAEKVAQKGKNNISGFSASISISRQGKRHSE